MDLQLKTLVTSINTLKQNATVKKMYYLSTNNCGIYLIPLQDVRPDIDLCPPDVSKTARNAMMIAIFQKMQDPDCVDHDYIEARNQIQQYCSSSDGYRVLYQLLRNVHPHLIRGKKLYNLPFLSQCENIYEYADLCRNYILVQEIKNRIYSEKEKSEMFLQNIDDPTYEPGRAKCLAEIDITTNRGDTEIQNSDLRFENLPTTLIQYNNALTVSSPGQAVVRAMRGGNQRMKFTPTRSKQPFRKNNPNYKPIQCLGCGIWGHPVTQCKNVPKIAMAQEYIKRKPQHVAKLVEEHKRVNNPTTKTGTVRVMLSINEDDTQNPEQFLETNDIDIPMETVHDTSQE